MHNALAQITSKTSLAVGRDDRIHAISEVTILVEDPDYMIGETGHVIPSSHLKALKFGISVKGLEALESEIKIIRASLTAYGMVAGQYNSSMEAKAEKVAAKSPAAAKPAPNKSAKK
ncbi:MAG: hypothetical protein COA65_09725 [Rhodospirillaceae bacterium]|nr:MAG: hypothetical protein COA65_09725 [Rhodospirillaceae bacterium]